MKIAILTHPIQYNAGGVLQCLALSKYLQGLGHTVEVIDRQLVKPNLIHHVKSALRKFVPSKIVSDLHRNKIRKQNIKLFGGISITQKIVNQKNFETLIQSKKYDILIVGSDQVWRYEYIKNAIPTYFLANVNGVKKLAYAASFGKDYWEEDANCSAIVDWLSDFSAISVREQSGISILEDTFKQNNASVVCDPVMLMPIDFYDQIAVLPNTTRNKKLVVVYTLDYADLVTKAVKPLLDAEYPDYEIKVIKNQSLPASEWLGYLKSADFVITDSFHGTVFSLIYATPFLTVVNSKRGSARFDTILSQTNMSHRVFRKDEAPYSNLLKNDDILHERKKFNELRYRGEIFLNENV